MSTKPSEPEKVDVYMRTLKHPLSDVAQALRQIVLSAGRTIGEEIKWNAPSFFYTGEMKPFDPKAYKRHIIVFHLRDPKLVRLVFPSGAKIKDTSGLLEGDYADGRRMALFRSMDEVVAKETLLRAAIRRWLALLETK